MRGTFSIVCVLLTTAVSCQPTEEGNGSTVADDGLSVKADGPSVMADAALADQRLADHGLEGDQAAPDAVLAGDQALVDAGPVSDQALVDVSAAPVPNDLTLTDGPPIREQVRVQGDLSGHLCGDVELTGASVVPAGASLVLCAGTVVTVTGGAVAGLAIAGELVLEGAAEAKVRFEGRAGWRGLRVGGLLRGQHFEIYDASTGIEGAREGRIDLAFGHIERCQTGFRLENGGDFDHVDIIGGSSLVITGGSLNMTDSLVDFQQPRVGPDCVVWNGGGAVLDHVQFTNCHCPIHINRADLDITVSDSVFDGAAVPVMIAHSRAIFRNSHFDGAQSDFLDIGGSIDCDLADNYFGGLAPNIGTGDPSQFQGAMNFLLAPVAGVGPR